MKTTVNLPNTLLRRARATAAERGTSLENFIVEAVENRLLAPAADSKVESMPWMQLLCELPQVPHELLDEVERRVVDADAADIAFQATIAS